MLPALSTQANGGLPAGLRKRTYGGIEQGAGDMTGGDFSTLIGELTKFFLEEAAEPEHSEDERPGTEPHLKTGAEAGKWPPPKVATVPDEGHEAVSHHVERDPEQSLDEEPRTLYVNRPLMNADEVIDWARKAGFKKTLPPEDMHVTIAYSKTPLKWPEAQDDHLSTDDADTTLNGTRSVERLGDEGAIVLRFEDPELSGRWNQLKAAGAEWKYPEYKPHVTFTMDPGDVDLEKVEPFTGALELGPEKFAEIGDRAGDWAQKARDAMIEDDGEPTAAGAIAITPRGEALFVRRCPGSDYPGTWCWPGGNLNPGESARDAAVREGMEETGMAFDPAEKPFDRQKNGDVDFATFAAPVNERRPVKLSDEHDDYVWRPITDPPQPLHPGVAATLQRLAGLAPAECCDDEAEDDFHEADHPRAGNGKFSAAGEGAESGSGTSLRERRDTGGSRMRLAEHGGSGWSAQELSDYGDDELSDNKKAEGALSETDREKIGAVGSEHREEMPSSAFLEPASMKYPVKERSAGGLKFNRRLLLAAARRARMNGKPSLAEKADSIRAREFDAGDEDCALDEAFDNLLDVFEQENGGREPDREEYAAIDACARAWFGQKKPPKVATDSALRLAMDKDTVRRFDKDGRLHVEEANICKACVSPYRGEEIPGWEQLGLDRDKVYKLLRDPEEIEKAAESANGIQILGQHTPVDADDHKPYDIVGATGSRVRWEHPYLKNSLHFWTRPSINDIESEEKRELSPGYHYEPDMTPGEYEGEKYDGVMRNIVFNHVAQVAEGRQGQDVVVGDSLPAVEKEWRAIERALSEAA